MGDFGRTDGGGAQKRRSSVSFLRVVCDSALCHCASPSQGRHRQAILMDPQSSKRRQEHKNDEDKGKKKCNGNITKNNSQ